MVQLIELDFNSIERSNSNSWTMTLLKLCSLPPVPPRLGCREPKSYDLSEKLSYPGNVDTGRIPSTSRVKSSSTT